MAIMEPNNFEKNVQRKLGELKIPPSESIWENIENRIGKKDKKRRAVFILLFLFLFLSLGGFLFINSIKNKQQKNVAISNVLEKGSKPTNIHDSSLNNTVIKTGILPNSDSAKVAYKSLKFQNETAEKIAFNTKKKITTSVKTKRTSSKLPVLADRQENNKVNQIESENLKNPPVAFHSIEETKFKKEKDNIQKENQQDSLPDKPELQNMKKVTSSKKDSLITKFQKKNQKHPWFFGVTFSAGKPLIKNPTETNSSVNAISSGIPASYINPYPSKIKNSIAFIAGVFLEKNISDKNKISFGISYQYFSLITKIGRVIIPPTSNQTFNSSGNFYSADSIISSYRNNFHLLEVPLSFNVRLNKSKKAALFWNTGINISELIGTNALQFQSNPGIYYKDNSLFNKTQFGLHTGVSVTFFAKEKNPLTIGPYFYYNPTSMANKGLYSKRHYSFIGIKAEILFKKK